MVLPVVRHNLKILSCLILVDYIDNADVDIRGYYIAKYCFQNKKEPPVKNLHVFGETAEQKLLASVAEPSQNEESPDGSQGVELGLFSGGGTQVSDSFFPTYVFCTKGYSS